MNDVALPITIFFTTNISCNYLFLCHFTNNKYNYYNYCNNYKYSKPHSCFKNTFYYFTRSKQQRKKKEINYVKQVYFFHDTFFERLFIFSILLNDYLNCCFVKLSHLFTGTLSSFCKLISRFPCCKKNFKVEVIIKLKTCELCKKIILIYKSFLNFQPKLCKYD